MAIFHPLRIVPLIIKLPHNGRRTWALFAVDGKRIAFFRDAVFKSGDMVFINIAFLYVRNKAFPDAALIPARQQRMAFIIPLIKNTYDRNLGSIWRPHGEMITVPS